MANKDTKYTIEVELKGDSKQVQQAIKDGLSKDFSAKIGADNNKLIKDINNALKELNSSDKKVKIGIDGEFLLRDINRHITAINNDGSLKKLKLGVDKDFLLRDINKAITSINSGDSLKKLKLGVDVNYLQQQLNKAVKGLDTTVKLKTKLETTSRTSETKGTVTTNKTSKEEAQQYQSLFSKRAASIANLDRAYQEFGRNSKEVSAAIREFAAASKDVRKFGRDTGVLSLNKVKSDIERQLGAGLTTDFTKNWLRMEYDKVLKDIDNLDRQLKPEKYEKIQAKAEYQRLDAEHKDLAAQLKAVADAYKAEEAEVRRRTQELKFRTDVDKGVSKGTLKALADSARFDSRLDNDKMQKFMEELQNYRNLTGNYRSSYFYNLGRELGITEGHPYFPAMQKLYQSNLDLESKWRQKPITANVDVKGSEKVEELNQKILTTTQQFMRLRGEALKAGNALNQATDPKDIARLKTGFEKAIQALVNYQRATRGLTKGGEAQLVEKLAVGKIKEQTEAWKVLYNWVKKTVQEQRNFDVGVGRRLPQKSKDTDFMSWLTNMDMGRALAGTAYAARGELNTVQALGNMLSSLSNISGAVGVFAKVLGGAGVALMAFTGMLSMAASAFTTLINTLSQVGRAIYDALRPGIELYKLRETSQLSFAATLSNMATEKGEAISYERGLEMSADLVNRAFMDALKSAFNPEELIRAMQGTLGIAFAKGLNLEQAYNVVKSTAAVGKAIQLPQNQLLQEVRDILQGTLTAKSSQVAYTVGMNPEDLREAQSVGSRIGLTEEGVKQAEEQGRLYDYIMEKMQTYNIALEKYADTFSGAMDRLTEAWALAGMKIFEKIAPGLNGVIDNIINDFILTVDENNTPQISDNLKQVGEALNVIMFHIMSVVDTLIGFIKDVTGEEDTIGAIKVLLITMIDMAAFGFATLVQIVEWLKEAIIGTYNIITKIKNLGGVFAAATEFIESFTAALLHLVTFDFKGFIAKVEAAQDKAAKDIRERWNKDVVSSEQMKSNGLGIFNRKGNFWLSYAEGQAEYNSRKPPKPTNMSDVESKMAKDMKQSYADQRKAIQEFIEGLKQTLKEAIANIKDKMEQNDLAYQQGYKSIEEYFTQKSALELEEAQFKLQTLIAERNAIASLSPTNDSERYQWQRDLIRTDGEIALAQREANKKHDQANELASAILHQLSINSYQRGLGYNNTGGGTANISSAISAYGSEVSSILTNSLNNQDMINFETAMQHGTEGCVEFADRFLAQFDNFFKEMLDSGVFDTDLLIEHAREVGMQIQDATEEAIRSLNAGDVIFADTGTGFTNGHTLVVLSNNNGAIQVAANASSTYDNANGSYMLNSGEEHIRTYDLDSYLSSGGYSASTIIKSGERIAQSLNVMQDSAEQVATNVQQSATNVIQATQKTEEDIKNSLVDLQTLFPMARSKNVEAYLKAAQEGQIRWLESVKNFESTMNNNPLRAVEAAVASVYTKLTREAKIARNKFGNHYPELADTLEKMIPIEMLKAEAKQWEQTVNNRAQWIEDDAKGINKLLREKSMLYPDTIQRYVDYFTKEINEWTVTEPIQNLERIAHELANKGDVADARNIMKKVVDIKGKITTIISSWLDEMNSYFNYRRELVEADTGLTSFVREERVSQLNKGQARVNAVAYGKQAEHWSKVEAYYEQQRNGLILEKQKAQEENNKQKLREIELDEALLKMQITDAEQRKEIAKRQEEINKKKGEEKTLWQETMDVANEALQNGLYNFMTDYINTAESIGEAFRNMAIDILKDLQKFFAKKAITDLMHIIVGEPNLQYFAPQATQQTAQMTGNAVQQIVNSMNPVQTAQETANAQAQQIIDNQILGVDGQQLGVSQQILYYVTNIFGTLQQIAMSLTNIQTSQATSVFSNVGDSVVRPSISDTMGKGRATGGYISGPGTSTSDSIHAMLSNGEYVIKADAVRRYGLNFLDAVNNGHFTRMRTVIPRFADGGYVGDALQDTARGMTDFAKNIGTSVSTTNNMNVALVRNEQEAYEHFMRSPAGQRILVDFQKGNGRVFARFNS